MFFSLAVILLLGVLLGGLCKKLRLPALLGMLVTGILIGPYALNWIDGSILGISAEIRKIALIIILARAGLSLNVADLKKVGRSAVLMCFVPACFEILGMLVLAPALLGVSLMDAAIMGAVVGAVSPAVIVPKMLGLIEEGYGKEKSIPQMILAGASVDDVFVIVMFSVFTGMEVSGGGAVSGLLSVPVSIALGIGVGLLCGWLMERLFTACHIRDTVKLIVFLSIAFLLVAFEDSFSSVIPFSSLIAVMCAGIMLQKTAPAAAARMAVRYNKMWVAAEILLFVLVGATVNLSYALTAGVSAVLLIFGVLVFRMAGVCLCMAGTELNARERIFCMLAYSPKATVQAAIGGIPLSMGLACGNIVLTVAVLSILITAPLGAFLIDKTYKKLLKK